MIDKFIENFNMDDYEVEALPGNVVMEEVELIESEMVAHHHSDDRKMSTAIVKYVGEGVTRVQVGDIVTFSPFVPLKTVKGLLFIDEGGLGVRLRKKKDLK